MNSKSGYVYYNGRLAGMIRYNNGNYVFIYDDLYVSNPDAPSISVTLPKTKKEYHSTVLFPFFSDSWLRVPTRNCSAKF